MATEETTTRRPSGASMFLHNLTNVAALLLVIAVAYIAYPYVVGQLRAQLAGVPILPPLPTAQVAPQPTLRPYSPPAQPAAPAPAGEVQQPAQAVPTAYTWADAEATSTAAYNQAVQQADLNAAPLPNESKAVEQPADEPNRDWCRGSHADNPECQPGNGSKEEK
jgi:hypothetical protein